MKTLKYILPSLIIILMTAFTINLINATNSYAQPNPTSYQTVTYHCSSGEDIDRCAYGPDDCDIAGQELCDSENQQ